MASRRSLSVCSIDSERRYVILEKNMKHLKNTIIITIGNMNESGKSVDIEVLEEGFVDLLRELGVGRGEFYLDRVFNDSTLLEVVMSAPVEALAFSARTSGCLEHAGITTIGQLANTKAEELFKMRNFGRKSLTEIQEELERLGLKMKEDDNKPHS